jgi:uncharacterized metal-binding protein/predicted Fe-Mo cluster-binding NifX family protein
MLAGKSQVIWGIPLVGDRVAPRCTCADAILLVSVSRGRVASRVRVAESIRSSLELVGILARHAIEGLVCGGLGGDAREALQAQDLQVIDNVACSADEVIAALDAGVLCPGFGFAAHPATAVVRESANRSADSGGTTIDCLACTDRICLSGLDCLSGTAGPFPSPGVDEGRWLEAATDVAREDERRLCRVAEVVYFCLEMRFRRVGLAFCAELLEPCRTLAGVLSRFFDVVPVCCKVGGEPADDGAGLPCNPLRQAQVLNDAKTEINVVAGLCIGADCVFNRASAAPVTTLLVKDKSLAHNPIGALYSERYLNDSVHSVPAGRHGVGQTAPARPWHAEHAGHKEDPS